MIHRKDSAYETIAQIVPVFQPRVFARSGHLSGFEALARLPQDGHLLGPASFIATLTRDQRLQLFSHMVKNVVSTVTTHIEVFKKNALTVGINLEPDILSHPDAQGLLAEVPSLLRVHMDLEIVERPTLDWACFVRDVDHLTQNLHYHVSLDDFGVGGSGIRSMMTPGLRRIKFDGFFVNAMHQDKTGKTLHVLLVLVKLARRLGLITVIERVESPADFLLVRDLVDEIQGYHTGKPLPFDHHEFIERGAKLFLARNSI